MKKIAWGCLVLTLIACGGTGGSGGTVSFQLQEIGTGYDQPIQYKVCPGSGTVDYVVERTGRIRAVVSGVTQSTPALDISTQFSLAGETGLLGIAFDPNFTVTRYVYLYAVKSAPLQSMIIRYTANPGLLTIDPSSAQRILTLDQEPATNHKGGTINFGPDGYLYLALGDGGANDANSQDPTTLLGKMIRIDVSGDVFPVDMENNYGIPSDNPFATSTTVRKEIWAYGLRNPFRWSFDSASGGLLIADVGQSNWEEINFEPANRPARNYGWSVREGKHDGFGGTLAGGTTARDPFIEYDHTTGQSITGGYIIRNTTMTGMDNHYLFADFVSNKVWHAPFMTSGGEASSQTMAAATEIVVPGGWNGVVSIDPDRNGEPVITELSGRVARLIQTPTP